MSIRWEEYIECFVALDVTMFSSSIPFQKPIAKQSLSMLLDEELSPQSTVKQLACQIPKSLTGVSFG